jgi:hypothetical protein
VLSLYLDDSGTHDHLNIRRNAFRKINDPEPAPLVIGDDRKKPPKAACDRGGEGVVSGSGVRLPECPSSAAHRQTMNLEDI